ncbi:8-O-methyltransferase [Nocardiopsis mwathae]|uniref:8-O-methyltransferase n=1 Tax=Nocardiopsis mwathae TaxID=1472723 RepID=A0A7W9YL96_9ACTN|nr:methyltransferase [Nocardiopsis mwathae]MBB6174248.1 8-O-methyltransferase [Nocardiopsis mwathae]
MGSDDPDVELQYVMDIASGFWRARALFSGVELGLFTQLAKGPATETELSQVLGLHPSAARDFFDALVALGLLNRNDDRYENSPAAHRYLDKEKDSYVGGFFTFMSHALYPGWQRLTELLRSGSRQEGVDSFDDWYRDLDQVRGFMDAMDSVSAPVTLELIGRFDWGAYESFADLGGARGNLAGHLAKAHPHLRGTCLDVPALRPLFDEHMAKLGTSDRIGFQGADFRSDPLPEADVLIFGHVLHDWDEETRILLVKRAFDAIRPGGALLIYEELLDDDRRGPARSLLMSLNMRLVRSGGSEYTVGECRSWLKAAGFTGISVENLTATERLVVARKA